MKSLILKRPKPRNRVAMAGRCRLAGRHQPQHRPTRHSAETALRTELRHIHPPPS